MVNGMLYNIYNVSASRQRYDISLKPKNNVMFFVVRSPNVNANLWFMQLFSINRLIFNNYMLNIGEN